MNLSLQKKIFIAIYVILAVLFMIFIVTGLSKFSEQNNNKKSNKISESNVEVIGENDLTKLYNKYNNEFYEWDYFEYNSIKSSDMSSYEKLLRVFQNLGYLSENAESEISASFTIPKKKIDYMMSELFSNTDYEPIDFYHDCSQLSFIYNEKDKEYKVEKHSSGCGDGAYYVSKVYGEKITSKKLTFKAKVLLSHYSGEYYKKDNSGNLVSLNVYENDVINDKNVLDKYGESANIYEWTFIKNSNDNYVLESVEKIK